MVTCVRASCQISFVKDISSNEVYLLLNAPDYKPICKAIAQLSVIYAMGIDTVPQQMGNLTTLVAIPLSIY
jgi:hypothetical protein